MSLRMAILHTIDDVLGLDTIGHPTWTLRTNDRDQSGLSTSCAERRNNHHEAIRHDPTPGIEVLREYSQPYFQGI